MNIINDRGRMKSQFTYEEFTKRQKYIFSEADTKRIRDSKIGVFGVGGNGAPSAIALTRFGVGYLRLVDPDVVELSNLGAQPYSIDDLNVPKVKTLCDMIQKINPLAKVEAIFDSITDANVYQHLKGLNVVIDGMDDYRAKVALSRAAKERRIPIVHTSGLGYRGSLVVFMPGGPTYEELFELPSKGKELKQVSDLEFLEHRRKVARIICENMFPDDVIERMNEPDMPWHGLVAPCHIFGVWGAMEAIKIVIGKSDKVITAPRILHINFMSNKVTISEIEK